MKFKILYVEDTKAEARDVERAVHADSEIISRPIEIRTIKSPDEIEAALGQDADGYDLVLADVIFRNKEGVKEDRLNDIIRSVKDWCSGHGLERALPIIAYTGAGRAALDDCLKRRKDLYDIWDKSSARPEYVAWRFKQLALELTRTRPDALLQRRIRSMGGGASWHGMVKEMTTRYDAGKNEHDQIDRASASIRNIAAKCDLFDAAKDGWKMMSEWEPLSRAVSRRARGHARHVMNVFWLGYYLLHEPHLRSWRDNIWKTLVDKRSGMDAVKNMEPHEALSVIWFCASIFHDVAGCIEKQAAIAEETNKLLGYFSEFSEANSKPSEIKGNSLKEHAQELFVHLGDPLRQIFQPLWESSLAKHKPDHGVVAGVHLIDQVKSKPKLLPLVREAARAMMLHNLMGEDSIVVGSAVNWHDEPLACLLILCDQIQTWDRERGDQKLKEMDHPERAELSGMEVSQQPGEAPGLSLSVEYIAPRHLDRDPERFDGVKRDLDDILHDKPIRALAKVTRWPFNLKVAFWLNGRPLNANMSFESSST